MRLLRKLRLHSVIFCAFHGEPYCEVGNFRIRNRHSLKIKFDHKINEISENGCVLPKFV